MYYNITVLGTILGPPTVKTITKTPVELKIMKNPDFGLLEMLFCCAESNIIKFGCTWIGEKIVTKIVDTFSLVPLLGVTSVAFYTLNTKCCISLNYHLNF